MSENFKQPLERPDRVLGDEWADWDGKNDNNESGGLTLFIVFSSMVLFLIDAVLLILYYLTYPRLVQFGHGISAISLALIIIWILLTTMLIVQLGMTVYSGKNCFFFKKQIFFIFDLVFARVFKLARVLRISRDKVGHSFVLVSNAVVRAVEHSSKDKRIMILLPRCLTKETIQEIYKIKETYPVEIFTVSGGELARKKVKEFNPSAIIGVACERDLVSGIRDVAHKIPVIGLPNKRPNGPCKDTIVDVDELRKTVEFYLK